MATNIRIFFSMDSYSWLGMKRRGTAAQRIIAVVPSGRQESQFFNAPRRIAVPGLAARALPEVLTGFETTGGAAVARQRLGGMVQGALYLRMVLLMLEALTCHPFGGRHQRRLGIQVAQIPQASGGCGLASLLGQCHDGIKHVERRGRCIVLLQTLQDLICL